MKKILKTVLNSIFIFIFIWFIQQIEGDPVGYVVIAVILTPIAYLSAKAMFEIKEEKK